jgi:hypothetical protein
MRPNILIGFTLALVIAGTSHAQNALPWPAPDTWNAHANPGMNSQKEDKIRQIYNEQMLVETKTAYIQIALPPEDCTAPEWFTNKYQLVAPDLADVQVFVKHSDEPVPKRVATGLLGLAGQLSSGYQTPAELSAENERVSRGSFWLMVRDKKGTVVDVSVGDTVGRAWYLFRRDVDNAESNRAYELNKQAKIQLKREQKEAKKRANK